MRASRELMNEDWLPPEQIPIRTWLAAGGRIGGALREGAPGLLEDPTRLLRGGST